MAESAAYEDGAQRARGLATVNARAYVRKRSLYAIQSRVGLRMPTTN